LILSALRILLALSGMQKPVYKWRTEMLLNGEIFDWYMPAQNMRSLIILVHGMSPAAHRDPRIIRLAASLSSAGFAVAVPLLPEIRDAKIDPESPAHLLSVIQQIVKRTDLHPFKKVSVIGPSFSGAVALLAAARDTQRQIQSVLSIGAFSGLSNGLSSLLTRSDMDDYARLIILENFLPRIQKTNPDIIKAIKLIREDNWHKRDPQISQSFVNSLPKNLKIFLEDVLHNKETREDLSHRILQNNRDFLQQFNVSLHGGRITASIFLLHGRDDNVIPASESRILYQSLREKEREVSLLTTTLLSHGDSRFSVSDAGEILRFLFFLSRFFKEVKK